MDKEFASENKKREQQNDMSGKARFRRGRFRALWNDWPEQSWLHLQGSSNVDDDPDGFGIPLSPDSVPEWEKGRDTYMYDQYEESWNDLRGKAERTTRRAAEQFKRYTKRATQNMQDTNWDAIEHDVQNAVEKVLTDLGEAFSNVRRDWNRQQQETQSSPKSDKGPQAQRVPVEYNKVEDPFAADSSDSSPNAGSTTSHSQVERDTKRRALLEELRSGAISIEEAERRLSNLG